jgi:TIR domain/Pentapeptide repeats (8 copies)
VANPEHLKILHQGMEAWNAWRLDKESRKSPADLRQADLSRLVLNHANLRDTLFSGATMRKTKLIEADLRDAHLTGVDLRDADLTDANLDTAGLNEANLEGAELKRTNLSGAFLIRANLKEVNLEGANLEGAYLEGARFVNTGLKGANLTNAVCGRTIFGDVDLRTVQGLDTVRHTGPSVIGIDTVYRSKALIPARFLRGSGVPDEFVRYLKSKLAEPVEFYSCFISYASQDGKFAEHLHADLQKAGVRCWFAPKDLKIGDRFQERIEESIRIYDKLLIVLSAHSVSSHWVEREVEAALEREQRAPSGGVLFPIRLDDSVLETDMAWAADVRRVRHIGDFRRWQEPAAFKTAFEQLLRDLKAETAGKV